MYTEYRKNTGTLCAGTTYRISRPRYRSRAIVSHAMYIVIALTVSPITKNAPPLDGVRRYGNRPQHPPTPKKGLYPTYFYIGVFICLLYVVLFRAAYPARPRPAVVVFSFGVHTPPALVNQCQSALRFVALFLFTSRPCPSSSARHARPRPVAVLTPSADLGGALLGGCRQLFRKG